MRTKPDYQYHVDRARTEMDCAYQAADHLAAAAHMKLSALHMAQARLAKAVQAQAFPLQSSSGAPDAA